MATCTLSGADAVLGTDCTTAGSPTNAATCVTTGCPAGQAACCRRTKQLYKWNFSQPALVGEVYVAGSDPNVSVGIGKGCAGSAIGLAYAILSRTLSVCPSNATTIYPIFDRAVIGAGATLTLPATGFTLIYNSAAAQCTAWSGTARLDSDVPDWSITLNATCTSGALTGTQVVGSMSGAE